MTDDDFTSIGDLPDRFPIFPLAGALLFPRGILPLNIFEPRYLNMIDDARASNNVIGMVQALPTGPRSHPDTAKVGCLGRIVQFNETGDARYLIALKGVCRFHIAEELAPETPYRQARPDWLKFEHDLEPLGHDDQTEKERLLAEFQIYLERNDLQANMKGIEAAPFETLVNLLCGNCPFSVLEKQALLETIDLENRSQLLMSLLKYSGTTFSGGTNKLQ